MTRIVGLLSAFTGTSGVFLLLLAMNGVDRSPPAPPPARVTSLTPVPRAEPQQRSRPKPPPKPQPKRSTPPPPSLLATIGGLDLGLGGRGLDLGDSANALLGSAEPTAMTADTVDTLPTPTRQVAAAYPSTARARGLSGTVVLALDLDSRGRLTDVRVVRADPAGVFDQAAIQTVRQWSFAPATYQGAPVAVSDVELPITFSLDR